MARPTVTDRTTSTAQTYTGLPCAAGHTLRHRANRSCVQCQADAQRARRAALVAPSPFEDILG